MTNRITKKSSAAELLSRRLTATTGDKPKAVADSFAQAVGKRLEERHIARVPGLPDEKPQPSWLDLVIEHDRRTKQLQEQQQAQRQLEEEARSTPPTPAGILMGEIAKLATNANSAHIPLNGAQVFRAALGGGHGTVTDERHHAEEASET